MAAIDCPESGFQNNYSIKINIMCAVALRVGSMA
jgi:hypothetical protein